MSEHIIIAKDKRGIAPASAYDADLISKYPPGSQFEAKPLKSRSLPQERLYWQMLSNVVEATALGDKYPTAPKLHDALVRELGFVTVSYDLTTGKPYVTRDSTAFANMTQDEYQVFMDKAVARLCEITGCDVLALTSVAA